MQAAPWFGSLLAWEQALAAFKSRLNQAFGWAELCLSASAFIDGLLSDVAQDRLQSLPGRCSWPAQALRDLQQIAGGPKGPEA